MPINYENNNITGSGSLFINNSGNFASGLYVDNISVSLSGHTHLSSDITNFGSGVSGLLPVTGIAAGYDISVTNNSGLYTIASTNLVHTDSQQPQGFVNRTDSRISVSGNIFRIAPTGSSYSFYNKGIKVTKTSGDSLTIPNLTQINYIHFDTINNQISNKTTSFDFSSDIPIAYVAWNSGIGPSGQMTFFAEERHGIVMDTSTHKWIHYTFGAQYIGGLSIGNYVLGGDGSSNTHATISIGDGTLYQEDIEINITDSSSTDPFCQELSPIAQIPVYYHQGSTGQWVKNAATDYPVKYGVNGPQYNLLTGGTWTTPDVSTGQKRYFAVWILATNQIDDPIISIMGQRVDSNQGSAESNNSWSDVNLTNLPLSEVKPLYRLIFAADSNDYTNVPKCTLLSILDIRVAVISTIAGVSQNDHGSLFGLGDDDHSQYLHVDNARTVNAIHNFVNGLTVNGTGVSISGHTHGLKIGDGVSDQINYLSSDRLNVVGTGGTSISFNDSSNTITISGAPNLTNVVFTTGTQSISGVKTFLNNIVATGQLLAVSGYFTNSLQLNGTGVSLSGHSHSISDITNFGSGFSGLLPSTIVYTTGNQNISGVKTYFNQLNASGNIVAPTGTFGKLISNVDFEINGTMNINAAASILASGPITFIANPYVVSGAGYFTSGLFVGPTGSATPVSVSGHRQSYSTIDNFCTGVAECVNTPLLAGTGISLSYVNGTGLYINASGGIQISSSSSGFVVKTGINNYVTRYITNGNNINISYADGVSGNPAISLSGNLDLIQNITSTGTLRANSGIFTSGITLNGTGVVLTNRKINTSSGIGGGSDLSNDITIGLTGLAYNLSNINTSGFIVTTGNNGVTTRTISASGLNILIGSGNGLSGNPIIGLNPYTSGLNTLQSSYLYSNSGYFNNVLQLNGTGVSLIGHSHTISDISNFGSGVTGLLPTGTANYIPKFGTGGSGLNNSVIYESGNNIGIGITTPDAKLVVSGSLYTSDKLGVGGACRSTLTADLGTTVGLAWSEGTFIGMQFQNTDSYRMGIVGVAGSRQTRILAKAADNAGIITFYPGAGTSEAGRFHSDGRFGIGTTSPAAQLQVAGLLQGNSIGTTGIIVSNSHASQSANGQNHTSLYVNPTFLTSSSNLNNTYGLLISPSSSGTYTTTNSYGLYVNASTLVTGTILGNYAAVFMGGNVGIGTAAPSARLEVSASGTTNLDVAHFSNSNGVEKAKISLSSAGDGTLSLIDASNNTDIFLTSNTSTASYINAGNVGIGFTTPRAILDVSGVIRSTSYITSDTEFRLSNFAFSRVATVDSNGSFAGGYNVYLSGTTPKHNSAGSLSSYYYNSDGTIRFYTNSSQSADTNASERLRITSGGNVGIGTTTPTAQLHVIGSGFFSSGLAVTGLITSNSGNFTQALQLNGSGVSIIGHSHTISDITNFNSSVSGLLPTGTANYISKFGTSGSGLNNSLIFDNGTSIGIGTSSPSSKLHILGDLKLDVNTETNNSLIFNNNGSQVADFTWDWVNEKLDITSLQVNINAENGLVVETDSNIQFNPNGGGNVGIGTSSPVSKLQVNGLITANSGNFTQSLQVNGTGVSISGHTHTSSNITDFNSSVSGLFPSTIVYTTGNQNINGIKTFGNSISITATGTNVSKINIGGANNPQSYTTPGQCIIAYNDTDAGKILLGTSATGSTPQAIFNNVPITLINSGIFFNDAISSNIAKMSIAGSSLNINALDSINLQSNGNTALTIDGDGTDVYVVNNLGVGTFSPGSPLTVSTAGAAGTIAGASQTQIFQVNDASASDYVNLGHFNCESSLSRGSFMVSNNGNGAWQDNCLQFFTHGANYGYGYYAGNLSDAGCAMIVTQGSEITKLQIGNYNAAPIELFTDNTFRMIVDTAGNVGIGTATPLSALHVNGDITCDNIQSTDPGNTTIRVGSSVGYIDLVDNVNIYSEGEIGLKYVNANGGGAIKIIDTDSNTDVLTVRNNNVGIGINTPISQFHVVGTGRFSSDVIAESFIGASGTAVLPSFEFTGDPDTGLFSPAANTFCISTSGVERLRVNNAGNIGIGTINPNSRLTIGSGIGAGVNSNNTSDYNLAVHHSDMIIISPEDNSNNPVYTGITLFVSRPGGFQGGQTTLDFATRDRGNNFDRGVMARIVGGNASNTAANSSLGGELSLQTAATGSSVPTSRLFINRDGNVGIGTISPNSRLHVVGTGLVDGRLSISPTSAVTSPLSVLHVSGSVTNNASLMISGPTVIRSYLGAGNSDTIPFLASLNGDISASTFGWGFFDRGTDGYLNIQRKGGSASWLSVMTMDRTNGNIGIGTGVQATTPPEKLTVDGNIRLSDTGSSIGNRLQLARGGGTAYDYSLSKEGNHLAISTANDGTTFRYTQFGVHNGSTWTPRTVINNFNGNIGIGTTSPNLASRLTIVGSGNTSASAGLSIVNSSSTNLLYVRDDGNIGIGTTTPATKLQVNGIISQSAVHASAGLSAAQTIAASGDVVLQLTDKDDPNNWWNASTYRFLPTVSGNYFIAAQVNWDPGVGNGQLNIQLRKNGTTFAICQNAMVTAVSLTQSTNGIVNLNGSTDYVDLTAYTSTTNISQVINGQSNQAWTKLEAYKIS